MTRMFFHLCLIVLFASLTSCTAFDSEEKTSVSELEGEMSALDESAETSQEDSEESDESIAESQATEEDPAEDFEDFGIESATSVAQTAPTEEKAESSFKDIENFNEGLIEDELSDENMADMEFEKPQEPLAETEDLDLEMANVETPVNPQPEEMISVPAEPVVEAAVESVTATRFDNKITNLEYKAEQSGGSVVISAASPFEYQVRDEPEFNQTVIEIANVELPGRFKLPYIAKDFDQAVATVNAYQNEGSTTARFVIQYKNNFKPSVQLMGNQLMVMNTGGGASPVAQQNGSDPLGLQNTTSSGKKISIEMQDVSIKELVYFIADDVGANIIVDDEVTGKTNIKLKDVPWEEALGIVLKTNGLAYERRGNILRIANSTAITKEFEDETKRLTAESSAQKASENKLVKVIPVSYANLEDLEKQIKPFLSLDANVTIDKRSSSIIINDYQGSLKRAQQLIQSLDVQPVQVQIEGKIIEASEDFSREFGIQWGHSGGTIATGSQSLGLNQTIRADADPSATKGGYLANLTFGTFDAIGSIGASLAIYERLQKIKILSSPKVVTLNKERAVIGSTQQIAVFQTIAVPNVGVQNNVVFSEAKLSLAVTPQVSFNSDIILDVDVSRDVPGAPVGNPASRGIDKRSAQTKIIVKDGQSMVIGGIFSQDERVIEGGVPYLKDIPVLGYLFKTKNKEYLKSELVIFLTPRILNPENMLKSTAISSSGEVVPSPSETNENSNRKLDAPPGSESFDELENEVESL